MNQEQHQALLRVLASVPSGCVATYGQVAELAGLSGGARQVGALLRNLPKDTRIPWHRIINAQGKVSQPEPGAAYQRQRLEEEGVVFVRSRINLKRYQWKP